ncbi:hypothetical protein DBR11_00050 [Pedobacter sp. HMWF019]|uniref:DUF6520 family protein n=1 Tax=Pedobacter sp. HMWF019 TaxID=2056856 RepID=UPI000D331AFF|nr:DUF6520 family protein [Pedobacter sp. HMWF019]PTT04259.1 hypothetical protein DBR11_00050 [Pedobacter sp. HMWF019]
MKNKKFLLGLIIALIAGISAFATVKNQNFSSYWYIDNSFNCLSVTEPIVCSPGSNPCLGTQTVDLGRQLYNDSFCFTPLTKI